ncbi:hypothetical protein QP116_02225 [Pseudoglutamicibacter cumminsii]|uniref:Uncharacterized protein n=1 Tax=Pseudoglutamicibacter cumminsii TaxID=156979 RepID=A0AAP4C6V6_9MICC|nr:hypothetical protein [Pseudoglutamicibacter cumminsii]MDK6274570.1 hypothetical protein [Pseudoglutamicibacter cumminsii]
MKHGTRLVAGLSALGLMGAFLTGCGSKNPDEALCEDATAALEAAGVSQAKDLEKVIQEDPAKAGEAGKGMREAAEKHKDSEHAKPVELTGKLMEAAGKVATAEDPTKVDPAVMQEITQLSKEATSSDLKANADEFAKKCPAFSSNN